MPAVGFVRCHKGYDTSTTSDISASPTPKVKELYNRRHLQRRSQRQRPQKSRRRRKFYRLEQPVSCPNYCIGSDAASNTSDDHSGCAYVDQRYKRSAVPSVPAIRCFKICPSRSRPTHVCVPVYNQPEHPRLRLKSSSCKRSCMLHHACCSQSRGMCSVVTASRHSGGVVVPDELQEEYEALQRHYAIRNQGSTNRIRSSAKMGHSVKHCTAERPPPSPDSGRTDCRRRSTCHCHRQHSNRQFLALTESLLACLDADSSPIRAEDGRLRQRPQETSTVEHDSLNEDRGPCRESEVFNTESKILDSNQRNFACSKEVKEWNDSSPFSNSNIFQYKSYEPNTASSNPKTSQNNNGERFTPKTSCITPSLTIQGMTEFVNDFSFLEQITGVKNCGGVATSKTHNNSNSAVFPEKQQKSLNFSSYKNEILHNVEVDNQSKEDVKAYEKMNSVSKDNQPSEEQNDSCALHSASGTTSNQTIIDTRKLATRHKVPSSEHSPRISLSPCRNEFAYGHDERNTSWSRSSRSQASNKNVNSSPKTIATNSPSHVYHEFDIESQSRLLIPDSADDTGSKISSKHTKKSSRDNSRQNSGRSKTSYKGVDSISSILLTNMNKLTETNEQAAKLIDRTVTAHLCDRGKQNFVSNNYLSNPQSDATGSGSSAEYFNRSPLPQSPVAQLTMSSDLASEGPKFRKILKQMQLDHISHMENDLKRLKDLARSLDIISED